MSLLPVESKHGDHLKHKRSVCIFLLKCSFSNDEIQRDITDKNKLRTTRPQEPPTRT